MTISTSSSAMRTALSDDLKKTEPKGFDKVIDDATRKTFTARVDGAILEFAHKQPDTNFWTGVKYYGSGSNSRIRIPRTPVAEGQPPAPAPAKKRKAIA